MMFVRTLVLCTRSYNEMTVLTPRVEEIVLESGVQEGMVTVLTRHTTTGVTVNEALECLESDIQTALALFAPEERSYCHARMLRDYGSTAGNPTGHLKAMLTGNHCHFPHRASQSHADRQSLPFPDPRRRAGKRRRAGRIFLRIRRPRTAGDSGHSGGGMTGA